VVKEISVDIAKVKIMLCLFIFGDVLACGEYVGCVVMAS
jgi:hypothetical protein